MARDTLAATYPRIASFSKSTTISVQEVMQTEDLDSIFFLPLSQHAITVGEMLISAGHRTC